MPTSPTNFPSRLGVHLRRPVIALFALLVLGCVSGPESRAVATGAAATSAAVTATPAVVAQPLAAGAAHVYPGATWEKIGSPESVGYSSASLDEVHKLLANMATTGIMVVVNGKVLLEHGDLADLSYLASVRKSILAMLYGNYVESGQVRLDKTLKELAITDHGGLSDGEMQATIVHLLAARSGVYHAASNSGDNLDSAPPRGSQQPGGYYLYSNWDFNTLGTIFEQETGRDIYDALESDMAIPIGMEDFRRDVQRKSGNLTISMHPAYHMTLSTRDMARIGYLMLREGSWNGKQVIPQGWARQIVAPVTRLAEMNPAPHRRGRFGYGYLWWVFDGRHAEGAYEGAYTGIGAIGQYITVLPKLDMVISHKTRPTPENRTVSRDEYLRVLDALVAAKCVGACR